jgi:methyl-accepting chemotaxis protein
MASLLIFYSLVKGTVFVLLATLISQEVKARASGTRHGLACGFACGVVFGLAGVLTMLDPVRFDDGLIFDCRHAIVVLASVLTGPVSGVTAAVMISLMRLQLGGAGLLPGLVGIGVSLIFGLAIHAMMGLRFRRLMTLGQVQVVAAASAIAPIFSIPFAPTPELMWVMLTQAAPLVTLANVLAAVMGGLIAVRHGQLRAALNDLRDREVRLRDVADNAPGALYQCRQAPDGSVSYPYVSQRIEELIGLPAPHVIAVPNSFLQRIHPDDRAGYEAAVRRSAADLGPLRADIRVTGPNGRDVWLRKQASPYRDEDGSIIWNGFIRDVTNRKRIDEVHKESEAVKRKALVSFADSFEAGVGQALQVLAKSVQDMRQAADQVARSTRMTGESVGQAAADAMRAAEHVEVMASATEDINRTIEELTQHTVMSAQKAHETAQQVRMTHSDVRKLSEAAGQIDMIVGFIRDIAAQTNLLALNATIEAARAGAAGRGFSVVANEVKTLASQTSNATSEIAAKVKEIQGAALAAVSAVDLIDTTVRDMEHVAHVVADVVDTQSERTGAISGNAREAAHSTAIVSRNISNVEVGAQVAGRAAQQVLEAAELLGTQSQSLMEQVDSFVRQVRAAA